MALDTLDTVVLTGANGFIGSRVVRRLQEQGREVVVLSPSEPDATPVTWVRCDRSHLDQAIRALPSGVGRFELVHLAWDTRRRRDAVLQSNQVGVLADLLAASADRGVRRVTTLGTSDEFGVRSGILHEDFPPQEPVSAYGRSKRDALVTCRAWSQKTRIPFTWLRPFIVYGPGQGGDMLIPYAIRSAWARKMASFSECSQMRDFVHVDDVVSAVLAALSLPEEAPGAEVNVGCGIPVRVRDVLNLVAEELDAAKLFQFGDPVADEPKIRVADTSRAEGILGWRPQISWQVGVRETARGGCA